MDTTETKILATILIALGVLTLFVATFVFSVLRHQRKIRQLQLQKMQAEIAATEKDRARIAGDLHDELGPLLSSAKMLLGSADVKTEEDQQILDKVDERVSTAVNRIREIAKDLMPAVLLRRGLRSALEDYLTEAADNHSLHINATLDFTNQMISHQTSVHLYRIVQEVVQNTIKHAAASIIHLHLGKKEDTLVLQIRDDGKGFDQASLSGKETGVGLRSIANRVDVLQGDLYIDSSAGTAYTITVPCRDQGSSSSVINL